MSEPVHSGLPPEAATGRRGAKSASAFRTISEVARDLDVPQHVLRFWESKFSQVKPLKRGGGRRYYRPEDVELLRSIRTLLYRDGYTIKGVQKLMREGHVVRESDHGQKSRSALDGFGGMDADPASTDTGTVSGRASAAGLDARQRREIEAVIDELTEIRKLLRV
ncbi:MAG: MerR family transcriptional regulator [Alphaproteobacteria bacterium]